MSAGLSPATIERLARQLLAQGVPSAPTLDGPEERPTAPAICRAGHLATYDRFASTCDCGAVVAAAIYAGTAAESTQQFTCVTRCCTRGLLLFTRLRRRTARTPVARARWAVTSTREHLARLALAAPEATCCPDRRAALVAAHHQAAQLALRVWDEVDRTTAAYVRRRRRGQVAAELAAKEVFATHSTATVDTIPE